MIPLLGFCSKKGFTITKKILMSSKMSGFEVLAFKSIPHGRGGVIMIENDYAGGLQGPLTPQTKPKY